MNVKVNMSNSIVGIVCYILWTWQRHQAYTRLCFTIVSVVRYISRTAVVSAQSVASVTAMYLFKSPLCLDLVRRETRLIKRRMSYGAKRERGEWGTTAWKVEGRQGPREGRVTSFWQGPPSVILVSRNPRK